MPDVMAPEHDIRPAADDPAKDTFGIVLALSGAIPVGAYIAGVMDFLVQALQEWKQERGKDTIPGHRLVRSASGTPEFREGGSMIEFSRCIRHGAAALLLGGLLAGCVELKPYRTAWEPLGNYPPPVTCDPIDDAFDVVKECTNRIWERSKDYDLLFTEFTDQGLQYPSQNKGQGEAAYQINHTMEALNEIARSPDTKGISLVVFVHGWQHNAKSDDGNVTSFRKLLKAAADIEEMQRTGYKVVGVYVGWRGESVSSSPLKYLTFWDRKATATRIAQGAPRELFNRLRSFRCKQNQLAARDRGGASSPGNCTWPASGDQRRAKVSTIMIGHSFGAWILYNALAGSLVESLMDAEMEDNEKPGQKTVNLRYADMVVLLNPAFEASRYTPLHRIATSAAPRPSYQPPMLVAVTSSADWATRSAHPVGRFINSVFEDAAGEEERVATKYTMGHMTDGQTTTYITHELTAKDGETEVCKGWLKLDSVHESQKKQQARRNLEAEINNAIEFSKPQKMLASRWPRRFCGGVQLTHKNYDQNSVVWNIRSDATIMDDHNDITNPNLVNFIRQLYLDVVQRTWTTSSNAAPSTLAVSKYGVR